MNNMRTASLDSTEFPAGVLTECMVLHVACWGDPCLFLCTSRPRHELYLISTTRSLLQNLREVLVTHLKAGGNQEREALNPRLLVVYLRFEYCTVQESERSAFGVTPTAKNVDKCLDTCSIAEREASCDASDRTEECEFTR